MFGNPTIQRPFGITVFGSAIVRVDPDIVSVTLSASRLAKHPRDAFREVQAASQKIQAYFKKTGLSDVGSSRIQLEQTSEQVKGERRFIGYTATIDFNLIIRDLDVLEDVIANAVDAGANEVKSVDFQTSRIKELRKEMRQQAVKAAFEKAEVYCEAAGVVLGSVIHIEDENPEVLNLRGRSSHAARVHPDIEGQTGAFNPASIVVGGAVVVAFEIKQA